MCLDGDKRQRLIAWLATAKNKELRATFKLNDRDMVYHAGRVYLLGTNCPIRRVGSWRSVYAQRCIVITVAFIDRWSLVAPDKSTRVTAPIVAQTFI